MQQIKRAQAEQGQERLTGIYSQNDRIMDVVIWMLVLLIVGVTIYPLIYVISCSISSPAAVLAGDVIFLPIRPTLMSYQKVFEEGMLTTGLLNSLLYTVMGTIINLIFTTTGAYALSCKEVHGRKSITGLILFTMLFSGGMIPTYLVVKDLNMINTAWSILLPNAISVTNFLIMKNTFETTIPMELKEAAFVEGASQISVFFRIVLPLSKAIIAVMTMYYCVGHWNEYFNALLYLIDKDKQPLQVVLRNILVSNEINETISNGNTMNSNDRLALGEGIRYAIIVIASIPMVAIYPFFQRFFVKGVMVGAVKG